MTTMHDNVSVVTGILLYTSTALTFTKDRAFVKVEKSEDVSHICWLTLEEAKKIKEHFPDIKIIGE